MQSPSQTRPAFTLIEMVVVLAILGIALSIAGPSLMRPVAADGLQSVIDRTRNLALRRAEPVTLLVGADGKWVAYASRSGREAVGSGRLDARSSPSLRLDISALGLCTTDDHSVGDPTQSVTLNPLACTVRAAEGPAR
ncbi:MAG TPA: prepilin-type N-terminal cleavage/methylation domain-containing protein [Gemmatimonadaceae bacterium]|nr:prepilin-type N-terminal cleavage/methylation domain-containing protein [Gemmatimonadaceae bacterium]